MDKMKIKLPKPAAWMGRSDHDHLLIRGGNFITGAKTQADDVPLYTGDQVCAALSKLAVADKLADALHSMVVLFHPGEYELDGADESYLLENFPAWSKARAVLAEYYRQKGGA